MAGHNSWTILLQEKGQKYSKKVILNQLFEQQLKLHEKCLRL
jgi:hypothetical protein